MKINRITPTPAALAELGERLARIRKQQGYSQDALAEAAGIGVATLRRIEDGNDSKLGSWLRILGALQMEATIDALLPENFRSPMAEAKASQKRGGQQAGDPAGDFIWGDKQP